MMKPVMSTVTMAMVAADDLTSMLQLSAGVRQSQGQRIFAAVAEQGEDTICEQAAVGDVAPVTGSFTARVGQQAVVVAAGSVAGEAGSFCVAKQDVLLIQRTFGLNTARDFEDALGSKKNKATTTTTTDWATFDFAGDLTKKATVKVGECPHVKAGLMQTVEASVSDKQQKKLDADQLRVCGCRNFLRSTVEARPNVTHKGPFHAHLIYFLKTRSEAGAQVACPSCVLSSESSLEASLERTCTDWSAAASWTVIAKTLNEPSGYRASVPGGGASYAQRTYESYNITGGWQHCDKSWVVQGACSEYLIRD